VAAQHHYYAGWRRAQLCGTCNMENSKSDRLGRWLSPDPLAGDVTDPQSLNRYSYVLNNPTNFSDPLGLGVDPFDPWGMSEGIDGGGPCYLDWIATPCGPLYGLLTSGAAVRCPNCPIGTIAEQGPGGSTVFKQWVPGSNETQQVCSRIDGGETTCRDTTTPGHWAIVGAVGLAGIELGPADLALMGLTTAIVLYKNKDAVERIEKQMDNIFIHIDKLMFDPARDPRNDWRKQIRAFLKEARKWGNRISSDKLQDFYMKMLDAAERAVPQN